MRFTFLRRLILMSLKDFRANGSKAWLATALSLAMIASTGFTMDVQAKHKDKHDNPGHSNARFDKDFDRNDQADWVRNNRAWRIENENRFTDRDRSILIDILLGRTSNYRLDSSTRRLLRDPAFLSLPPGQQKRLLSGKPLPPGIAKKVRYLPGSSSRYFGYPSHYRIGAYGDDYFLYNSKTGIVLDVLRDLFNF